MYKHQNKFRQRCERDEIIKLREERMLRDTKRYDGMNLENQMSDARIETKKTLYKADKKN